MTGILILAAGSSSRLGRPKQNLIYQGRTLLQRTIETAVSMDTGPVLVITGANEQVIRPTIEALPVTLLQNNNWQEGMASSIRIGIDKLQELKPNIKAAILLLCDQPFLDTRVLQTLINNQAIRGIVACSYNETIGAPVLFDAFYFPELMLLKGQEGAKKLLTKFPDAVKAISFPPGGIDIDTPGDYEKLTNPNP